MVTRTRRLVKLEIEGDLPDSVNLSRCVAKILRKHADDIEDEGHIAGRSMSGEYRETYLPGSVSETTVTIRWRASYPKGPRRKKAA